MVNLSKIPHNSLRDIPKSPPLTLPRPGWKHPVPQPMPGLLGIAGMETDTIIKYLDRAEFHLDRQLPSAEAKKILAGRTIINLFFENSTRTRTSFEMAGKRLGADVINMAVEHSSIKKGETLIDTALTLNAMRPDFIGGAAS